MDRSGSSDRRDASGRTAPAEGATPAEPTARAADASIAETVMDTTRGGSATTLTQPEPPGNAVDAASVGYLRTSAPTAGEPRTTGFQVKARGRRTAEGRYGNAGAGRTEGRIDSISTSEHYYYITICYSTFITLILNMRMKAVSPRPQFEDSATTGSSSAALRAGR